MNISDPFALHARGDKTHPREVTLFFAFIGSEEFDFDMFALVELSEIQLEIKIPLSVTSSTFFLSSFRLE